MALVRLQRDGPVGCKMFFSWFYIVSAFPMHLTFRSMMLALGAVCEAQRWFPRPPGFQFLHVFPSEHANSEGRFLVAHAREAGSIISFFQFYNLFLK